ncbi:MAG: helix-turn-helix transcriptional regulator [Lachnospiraceae bacterium]|nr:helix-turn-helix transcriptional regulator [Lachnospiraceae bacterium]
MKVSLKALRVNANMNQKEVAKMMKISTNTLISWENNHTAPNALQMAKLCSIYKCSLDDIFLPDKLAKS